MNVKFSRLQAEWLCYYTGEKTLQEAVNMFVRLMREEGIDPSEILNLLSLMMARTPLPGSSK